jgi:hypothetical protein
MSNRDLEIIEQYQEKAIIAKFGKSKLSQFESQNIIKELTQHIDYMIKFQNLEGTPDGTELKRRVLNDFENFKPLTKYSHPVSSNLLGKLLNEVELVASKIQKKTQNRPFVYSAYSDTWGAMALKLDSLLNPIIIFEAELFNVCGHVCKLLHTAISELDKKEEIITIKTSLKDTLELVRNSTELKIKFKELIYTTLISNVQGLKPQKFSTEKNFAIYHELIMSTELFIMSHEYGHIYLNHFENSKTKKLLLFESEYELLFPDWIFEFEADKYATEILLEREKSTNKSPFTLLGPIVFFSLMELIRKFKNWNYNRDEDYIIVTETHPPNKERLNKYLDTIKQNCTNEQYDIIEMMSDFVNNLFQSLLYNFKEENPKPSH